MQIGRGVIMDNVTHQWETGSLENTNKATDLSISGTGMFIVSDPFRGNSYYTRAGNFEWDKEGNLVTPDGNLVQGYGVDSAGNISGIDNMALPNVISAPRATDNIAFGINLNGDAVAGDTFVNSITTYDSLGSEVILDIAYIYDETNVAWDWSVNVDPSAAACATTGHIEFDLDGNMDIAATTASAADALGNPLLTVTGLIGADDMDITWTYLDAAGTASDGSITGYSTQSAKSAQNQNGYPSGNLQTVAVDEDGFFTGIYSNGYKIPFAQLALADFASYSGLAKRGSNLYSGSLASGQPLLGPPNTAGLGSITPSTLEMSNVDLGTEFVEMITTQRAFQANSKVITTSDEILAELLNIKR